MDLRKRLHLERLYFDGGIGTYLQERGLAAGELPELWNLSHPDIILDMHKAYLQAGCTIFNTNTFGANRLKFKGQLEEIVSAGVSLAIRAREETGRNDAMIALDIGPSGKLLEPMGDLSFEDAVSLFGEVMQIGTDAGADLILIETMADSYETKAAVLAAKEYSKLPVIVTLVFDASGKLLTGASPEAMTAMLEGLHVDALGINCSLGPKQMLPLVERFLSVSSLPVIVNPNAGLPRSENGKTVFDVGPDEFSDYMLEIAKLGAHGIGGCCGTTPLHIQKMIEVCADVPYIPPVSKDRTLISSFSQVVEIGKKPVIIGERINPTGKKRFKEALISNNIEYILQEGLKQEEDGAHVLDVNVGLPEIDEPAVLTEVVKKLQSIVPLPLQIDTSNMDAMEQALRVYNGKPLINSVNGKQESMRQVFPIAAKYGGVLIALLLDEDGIPETSQKRIEIAKKIYTEAEKYGIPKKDIVLDALALTVSSDSSAASVTLETLQRIRDELHGLSVLGVSNISFGLPQRQIINTAFFTMALQSGLNCAIINPGNQMMMAAYQAYLALAGLDLQCIDFISKYGAVPSLSLNHQMSKPSAVNEASDKESLGALILQGLEKQAAEKVSRMLDEPDTDPLRIVNQELIPALNQVGEKFEQGTLFLPQLLMSAEAAKAAFEIVKKHLADADTVSQKKNKIILATVKGDIHDIGKNIVKVLLENYGYDVIDLGRDVPPEKIVETALKEDVHVVGLSALMTTTVVSMEETIKMLRAQTENTKIVVGGAVMNQTYADQIGADCYARDAMATVRYADTVFGVSQ